MICGNCREYRTKKADEMLGHLSRCRDGRWTKVVELRASGEEDAAGRLVRKILGVQGPVMDEETKEALRAWREAHKEEIKERDRRKRGIRARTLELLAAGRRR